MAFTMSVGCSDGANQFQFTTAGTVAGGTVCGTRLSGSGFPLAWVTLHTFAGDGVSPPVTLDPGVWVLTAVSGAALASLVHLHVADLNAPLIHQSRKIVADSVRASGIADLVEGVYEQEMPNDLLKGYPAAFVFNQDVTERDEGTGTNVRTHWIYPVKLMLAVRKDERITDEGGRQLMKWRQFFLEGFDWMYPGNDTAVEYTTVTPGERFKQYVFQPGDNLVTATEMTINCHARRQRGFPQGGFTDG